MNDGVTQTTVRRDPFGLGQTANQDRSERGDCPYPTEHVEARRWLAGWDHAELGKDGKPRPIRDRPWSRGELVVLVTLVRDGEKLSSLSSRLGRSGSAILDRCAIEQLELSEAQKSS